MSAAAVYNINVLANLMTHGTNRHLEEKMYRTGIGYDVHALAVDRPLIIGGVHIPHLKGLLGHSDADVLVHAVMDAILGALALGDIGQRKRSKNGVHHSMNQHIRI